MKIGFIIYMTIETCINIIIAISIVSYLIKNSGLDQFSIVD